MSRLPIWIAAAALIVGSGCSSQQPSDTAIESDIRQAVRNYMDATNKADATAMMDLFSQNPKTSTVSDGDITRGWEAIRTANDAMAGTAGATKMEVGSIDVMALGNAHAVAVAAVTFTTTTERGSEQEQGAMTLVLEKSPKGWKILHEHYSSKEPDAQGD